jgi:hypothetical protein
MNSTVGVPNVRNRFTIHAEDPTYARKIMRSTLSGAKSGVVEDAALLTSELVAHAMMDPGANPQLFIDTMQEHMHVEVRGFDITSRNVDQVRLRGWLLVMMNALAYSWGIESRSDCQVVWFDLSF